MKRYFLAAKDVGSLSRILCSKIAIEQSHQSSGPVVGWLSGHQAKCLSDEPNFAVQDRQLNFAPNAETRRQPEYLVKLFRLAQLQGLDIHPAALSRVTREIRSLKPEFREHRAVIKEFLSSLLETDRPADILRLMNEAGL